MSGVFKKDRKETYYDPVDTAKKLQVKVLGYVMSEKYIPKRWIRMIGEPMVRKSDEIAFWATAANETWLDNRHITERKMHWKKAEIACKQLDILIDKAVQVIPTVTPNSTKEVARLLSEETRLVTNKIKYEKAKK